MGPKQFAENSAPVASGAEALPEKRGIIAAPEALRHPKASLSANRKAHKRSFKQNSFWIAR